MFRIERTGPNRIDIEFGGKLGVDDMRRALDELLSAARGIEHGLMLFRVHDYRLPTLGAVALEFSRFFELMRMMRRFDRAALLADQSWIRAVSEIEGALLPGLEIRAFEPHQADVGY